MSAEIITFKKREAPKAKAVLPPVSRRVEAIDILRGLCVLGMILVAYAGDWTNRFPVLNHADWHGLALADMIFPGFLFCVGMAIPLSLSARAASQSRTQLSLHIVWRVLALVALGVALNGLSALAFGPWRLPGILQRIGLCYGVVAAFCLMVGRKSDADFTMKIWPVVVALLGLLIGYAVLLTTWRSPECAGACFDSVNSLPAVVDRAVFATQYMWPYGLTNGVVTYDPEGIVSTLGAIGNVLLGVFAMLYARKYGLKASLVGLVFLGLLAFLSGASLDARLPIIKKIWTPSFMLVSGGFALLVFVALAVVADVFRLRAWAYPIKIFGANATLAFVGISLLDIVLNLPLIGPQHQSLHFVAANALSAIPDARVASLAYSVILLAVVGLALWPLYYKRWFLKI